MRRRARYCPGCCKRQGQRAECPLQDAREGLGEPIGGQEEGQMDVAELKGQRVFHAILPPQQEPAKAALPLPKSPLMPVTLMRLPNPLHAAAGPHCLAHWA